MFLARGDLMDWWRMRGPGGMSPSHYQSTQTQHSSPSQPPNYVTKNLTFIIYTLIQFIISVGKVV